MARLWPRSLFGQLILMLLLVLTLAQLISAVILFYERGRSLNDILGVQSVEHITSMVRLFNSLAPPERDQAINAFNTSNLRISLDIDPLPQKYNSDNQMQKVLQKLFVDIYDQKRPVRVKMLPKHDRELSHHFESIMGELPTNRNCIAGEDCPGDVSQDSYGVQQMMVEMMGTSVFQEHHFLIQAKLDDESWVTFMQHFPEGLFNLPYRMLASLLVLIISVLLLSLFVVRKITKPIDTLALAADELGRDIQRPPMDESGPREVSRAAHAFNTMQSRLNQYIKDRSRLLAAISHDLKTPITRLRLRTELLNNAELETKFLNDLDDMQTMVGETLDYMRGQDNSEAVQKIDINALIESIAQDLRDAGHEITFQDGNQIIYHGRPLALKRCVTNLMENAVRYGDNATVSVGETGKSLFIRIVDTGPGIPQEQLEQIFEPFFRLESSRNRSSGGVGLGLGIARDIARNNGGDIYLHNRKEGGLEAVLEMPKK